MEQPGAFASFGCAGRCCVKGEQACAQGSLLEMLKEQNPLKVAKGVLINQNLTSRTTFSDLLTMVIRQLEWGTSTPVAYRRSAIMPLLEREGSNLRDEDVEEILNLIAQAAVPPRQLGPQKKCEKEVILPVKRTTCIKCTQKLPSQSQVRQTDGMKGDGTERSKRLKIDANKVTRALRVLTEGGEREAVKSYKRCPSCGLLHFQRASEEKLRTRRIVSVADRFRHPAATRPTPGSDDSRSTSTDAPPPGSA